MRQEGGREGGEKGERQVWAGEERPLSVSTGMPRNKQVMPNSVGHLDDGTQVSGVVLRRALTGSEQVMWNTVGHWGDKEKAGDVKVRGAPG